MSALPSAKQVPKKLVAHGDERTDPYYWLRDDDRQNPEVLDYLKAENDYCDAVLAPLSDLRTTLFDEIVGRIVKDDTTVPYHWRGNYYYHRYEEDKEHGVFCRRTGSIEAEETVLHDGNVRAEGHAYYRVVGLRPSPDGQTLAFGEDTVSRRQYTLRFRNLETGDLYAAEIPNTTGGPTWAADSRTVFYVTKDAETLRPHRVWRHKLNEDPATDELVYEETDPEFWVYVTSSSDDEYIFITSTHTVMQEVRYLRADTPEANPVLFLERERDHEHTVDAVGGRFYIRTNWEAVNFRLMSATPSDTTDRTRWRDEIPARDGVFLGGLALFDDYLAVTERENALSRVQVYPRSANAALDPTGGYVIDFPDPVYVARFGANPESNTTVLRLSYTSMTTPPSVIDFDMRTRQRELKKEMPVLGGFDKSLYVTERIEAPAADGALVPISLVFRRDLDRARPQPLLLYGYGSYGATMEPEFASPRLSLLDRGFIYAIAHVRGSQIRGRPWYDDGRLLRKRNTFTDFIAAGEHLVSSGYTAKTQLYALGGSAGGLLMGSVANMQPDLFRGIVAVVPFVDVVTTMLDESIPLTTFEYDEWGNPNQEEYYRYMLSYSPYDNVEAKDYPSMLVLTGLHDSQVQYWEPAKWVAKLRALKTDDRSLLFHTDLDAGHGGASGRFKRHKQTAMIYSFLLALAAESEHLG